MTLRNPDAAEIFFGDTTAHAAYLVSSQWETERPYLKNKDNLLSIFKRTVEEVLEYLLDVMYGQPPEAAYLELADSVAILLKIFRLADDENQWQVYRPNSLEVRHWQQIVAQGVIGSITVRADSVQYNNSELWQQSGQASGEDVLYHLGVPTPSTPSIPPTPSISANTTKLPWRSHASEEDIISYLRQISDTIARLGGLRLDQIRFNNFVNDMMRTISSPQNISFSRYKEPKLDKNQERRLLAQLQDLFVEKHDSAVLARLNNHIDLGDPQVLNDLWSHADSLARRYRAGNGQDSPGSVLRQTAALYVSKNAQNYPPSSDPAVLARAKQARREAPASRIPLGMDASQATPQVVAAYYEQLLELHRQNNNLFSPNELVRLVASWDIKGSQSAPAIKNNNGLR